MSTPRAVTAEAAVVLLLLLVAAVPRLVQLDADPPARVSSAYLTDEGWWAQNARQHALFGRWVMDDHNPALYVTPVYTLALRGVYAVAGVGLWQTRLLSALSGILTCLIFYAGLRAVLPRPRAFPPALFLALSLVAVTINRMAFTESLQFLLLTLTAAAVLWAGRRAWWGVLGGIALALAVLCKPNALVMAPILGAFWAGEWWRARQSGREPVPVLRVVLASGLGALIVVAVAAGFVGPHWPEIRHQLSVSISSANAPSSDPISGSLPFFLAPFLGLRSTLLPAESVVPLIGVVLLAWRRLTATGATSSDAAERLMWWWFAGGLLFQALQSYQPERRFLFLIAPLAALGWRGLVEEGVKLLPGASARGLARYLVAGGVAGALLAFIATGWLVSPIAEWLAGVRLGGEPGIAPVTVRGLLWYAGLGLGLGSAILLWRWAPGRGIALRAWPWLVLWTLLEPAAILRDELRPSYASLAAARALGEISQHLPPERRVVTGDQANTLALESDLFAFVIRDKPEIGARLNLDGWERFRPALLVTATRAGADFGYPGPEGRNGFKPLCTFPMRRWPGGRAFIEVTVWHAPELSLPADCPTGARSGR